MDVNQYQSFQLIYLNFFTSTSHDASSSSEQEPLLGNSRKFQQLQVMDNQIEYHESLINEREEEIIGIQTSITEVNEIFRDLGTLVNEQGYMLDNIESNVEHTSVNMQGATNELTIANEYHKKIRKRACIIGVFVILIVVVFGSIFLA